MKKLLVFVFCTLALVACSGGQKQNNSGQTADAESIIVGDSAEMTEITYKILKEKLQIEQMTGSPVAMDKITDKAEPFNNREYSGRNFRFFVRDDGNFSLYWYNYFFPKKSGGYDIIVVATNAGGDAYEPTYEYSRFAYSNGQLTRADKIIDLSINDFYSNADQFPEAGADGIKDAIENSPRYSDIDETSLSVTFFPWTFEGDDPEEAEFVLPVVLSGFDNKEGDKFPKIRFVWDGETFVRDPENKPIEEDLKYFKPTAKTSIAKEIFKKLFPDANCKNGGSDKVDEELSFGIHEAPDDCEGCYNGSYVYCYPKNSGGYLVAVKNYNAGPGCRPQYFFSTTYYNDVDFSEDYVGLLPSPELEMLLNPNKIHGHESDIAAFKALYDRNPDNYLYFECWPPNTIIVQLYPWDCDEAICNMDQCMLSSSHDEDQLLKYTWDGNELFVNPETVPSTNLESISGIGDNSSCDMQEIWRQFAEGQYDAVEPTIEGNTAEYYDQSSDEGYTIRIKLVSFAWEGSCKVFCVTDHTEGDESTNTLTEYNFIGGELSETELQPTLKEYADKSEASIENGEIVFASQDVAFVWNGSTMIKK